MSLTPWNRQEEWYQEFLDAIKDSGSVLPDVTSEDNGRVLEVVNGEWSKSAELIPITGKEVSEIIEEGTLVFSEHPFTFLGQTGMVGGYTLTNKPTENGEKFILSIYSDGSWQSQTITVGDDVYMLDDNGVLFAATDSVLPPIDGKQYKLGKDITLVFPSNVLNLYDESDPHEDHSYLPEWAEFDSDEGAVIISADHDCSAFYAALNGGKLCYERHYDDGGVYIDPLVGSVYDVTYNGTKVLCVTGSSTLYFLNYYETPSEESSEESNVEPIVGEVVEPFDPIGSRD